MAFEQPIGHPSAIPSKFNGIKFRSRLEARWAAFFQTMRAPWQYEPEGFRFFPGEMYLPDFLLPQANCWVEIKPSAPSTREKELCRMLCAATARRVILAYGSFGYWLPERSIKQPMSALCFDPSMDPDGEVVCLGEDVDYEPCICPVCGEFGFEFEGRGARICRGKKNACCGDSDRHRTSDDPRIVSAADVALKWSFWR